MKKMLLPPVNMLHEAKEASKGRHIVKEILIFVLVFMIAQALVSIPVTAATLIAIFTSDVFAEMMTSGVVSEDKLMELVGTMPDWVMLIQLFGTILATATAVFYCRYIEKRPVSSMGLRRGHIVREYGIGVLVGILLISLCVGICLLMGSLTLSASAFSPVMWLLFLVGFLIQGMSEEVMCRGYLMVSVSRKNALLFAVLTNSVVFGLLHLANPGFGLLPFVNIVLFGILESVYVLKRGDLWGASAIHSLWNFFQGNVFGISVSGTGTGASPLAATFTEGHELWNGGAFGLEGGLVVTVVVSASILLMLLFLPTSKEELAPASVEMPTEAPAV